MYIGMCEHVCVHAGVQIYMNVGGCMCISGQRGKCGMSPSLKSLPLGRTSSEGLAPALGSAWDSVSSRATLSLWMSVDGLLAGA